jgi:hypothetical protein
VHQRFMPVMHRNALRDPQIPPDAKNISSALHVLAHLLWNLYWLHPGMKK